MVLILRRSDDLAGVPEETPWLATAGTDAPPTGPSKLPDVARLLHETFGRVRDSWWTLGRAMSAKHTGWLSHAVTCASMNSDFGVMLAWDRIARDMAARNDTTLMICADPWLFRHLAGLPGVSAGRPPALMPAVLKQRARGLAARVRFALRSCRAASAARMQRSKMMPAARTALLVYCHPASEASGRDAYFGSLMHDLPGLVRVLHTDGPVARANELAADGASFSLHGFGNPLFALGGLITRWRPDRAEKYGDYGWLVRRAAEIEGGGAAAAGTRWQAHCQRRWLAAARPAIIAWPWENHPWERALVRAARKFNLATVGYQHTVIGRHMYNYSAASNPEGIDGLPDVILCNGPAYREHLVGWGFPTDRLAIGGAFRIAPARSEAYDPSAPVFVALAADGKIAAQMMQAIKTLVLTGQRFRVKDHPMYPFKFAETETIRRTDSVLAEQKAVSGVIYSTGTVGLEAMLSGLPTIRFLPEGLVAVDILPECLSPVVTDAAGLADALDTLAPPPPVAHETVIAPVDLAVWRHYLKPD